MIFSTPDTPLIHNSTIGGVSPLDNSPLPPVPVTTDDEIAHIVARAREAQHLWAALPIAERARIIKRAGRHVMGAADDIARLLHTELGKPLTDAYAVDLGSTPEVFHYYTSHPRRFLKPSPVHFSRVMFPDKTGVVTRQPHGVVALLAPWNYPISIPIHNIVPALLAGNAVVLKPSEYAARTGARLVAALSEGLPPDLVGLVQGDAAAGAALVGAVDQVVFIGGTRGGRAVAKLVAERLIPCQLELGGKDAAIVLDDADIERAAQGIAWAGFVNAGQSCAGVERVYVVEPVADAFIRRLTEIARSLRVGDDASAPGSVDIGAVSTPQQMATIERHVAEAIADGATLECGGTRQANYYLPTVLTGVIPTMAVMRDETFGPVVAVAVVPDVAAAVRAANATEFGLTGSVWSRDLRRGKEVAMRLKVGVVLVNNHMFSGAAPQAVWTGRGASGYGVQNGGDAVLAFTRPHLLAVDAHRTVRELWWFPYDRALTELGQGMLAARGTGSVAHKTAASLRMSQAAMRRLYAKESVGWTAQYTAAVWAELGVPGAQRFVTPAGRLANGIVRWGGGSLGLRGRYSVTNLFLVTRHLGISRLLDDARPAQVIELAAGLSARGLTWTQAHTGTYIEVDQPGVVAAKRKRITERGAQHRLVAADITRADLLGAIGDMDKTAPTLIIVEGVTGYLDEAHMRALLRQVRALSARFDDCRVLMDFYLRLDPCKHGRAWWAMLPARAMWWTLRAPMRMFVRDADDVRALVESEGFRLHRLYSPAELAERAKIAPPPLDLFFVAELA